MDFKGLIETVSERSGISQEECREMTDFLAEVMEDLLAEGNVIMLPSFGSFETRKRNERIISNPSVAGKKLLVPPKVVVSFKPSTSLKNNV